MIRLPPGTLLVLFAVACGVGLWGIAVHRWRRGASLLGERDSTRTALWGGAAGAAVWIATTVAAPGVPGAEAWPTLIQAVLRAAATACAVGGVWLLAARPVAVTGRAGAGRTVKGDLRDGAFALLLALPPTAVGFAATLPYRTVEGANPLLVSLLEDSAATWALVVVSSVLLAPIGEELLFRGLFQGSLRTAGAPAVPAVIGVALLFAAVHPPQDWAPLFALACVLGWSRERTGSVRPAVIAHALFNSLMLAWVLLDGLN